jgi:23S rRNA (pseudouridine1915-N3)-methyltransferase
MINIICIGKIKETYLKELITDYENRIKKYHKINIYELKEENTLKLEAININKLIKPNDYVIAMAIEGTNLDSVKLATLINETFNHYGTIDFIIGSSNGLDESVKQRANYILSMSLMTFPHGLFRGLLLEQIYRSFKIINHETYHK